MTEPYPYPSILTPRKAVENSLVIDGVDTHWWEYAAKPGAETLVLVHGFRGDHHGLELLADALPEFRVIIPDLPGFGSSSPWANGVQSVNDFGRWLMAFLDATHTSSATVVGHSFGSIVVANAMRGERTEPVVLINPISQRALDGPKRFESAIASLWYRIGGALPTAVGDRWLSFPPFVRIMSVLLVKTKDRALRRWVHEQHDRYFSLYSDRDSVVAAYTVSISNTVADFASDVRAPVLLVAAELDDITPLDAQQRVRELFPRAELVVISGVGHLVHYEKPIETAAAIRAFLTTAR